MLRTCENCVGVLGWPNCVGKCAEELRANINRVLRSSHPPNLT